MLPPEPTPAGSLRDILGLSNDLHHSESVASALPLVQWTAWHRPALNPDKVRAND
jgi:hypothetical protein